MNILITYRAQVECFTLDLNLYNNKTVIAEVSLSINMMLSLSSV